MTTANDTARELSCDVLIIGGGLGGPGGSTAGALLAEKGWRVTLLEKAPPPFSYRGVPAANEHADSRAVGHDGAGP